MQIRVLSIITVLAAAILPFSAAAQSDSTSPASAPLKLRVQLVAAGEFAALDGAIVVRSSVSPAADGTAVMSYVCDAVGGALGETSGTTFAISGADSGDVPVTQALPADVGISCAMTLVGPNVLYQFRLTLQAGLNANGTLTSLVIRTVAAL